MNRHPSLFVAVVLLATTSSIVIAQEPGASPSDQSLSRAKRLMRKIDNDGNGTFEKAESVRTWKRYQQLDADGDDRLTVQELGSDRTGYLQTGGRRSLDVVYKTIGNRELLLDLYYSTGMNPSDRCPVIIYTHGGGWAAGSKQGAARGSFAKVFLDLVGRGFAVASVDYRLCKPDSGVAMRDCVIDCKDAVRYLAKHSDSLGLDAGEFFVMGDSAGGQIAQMLLLSPPESLSGDPGLASTTFQLVAGVSWYGPCDFERMDLFNHDDRPDFRDRFEPRILGTSGGSDAVAAKPESLDIKLQRYREISPVNYLTGDSPPLLMIQGDKDTTIPVKHAYYMKERAEAVSAPVEIMIVRNAGHNWRMVDVEIDPSRKAIESRTVQFFVDHRQ
ncbi:Carboxylesterase NlhH [Crateriforma conspicua]|uniref:Carboxylesterase NlhH n=2 Tax=Crateriforma conspicua TaxID=2527996 RepID=A0A5C5YDK7_9PLAN|nr:Carboxylesterase NlhH [Crateriforma conspicua]